MISGWKKVFLEDITTKIGDGLHGTPKYDSNGEYYFINGNNLKNGKIIVKPDTKKVTKDEALKYQKPLSNQTILLSINGTIGSLALYNSEKCMLGKSACFINVSNEVDVRFLYYHCLDEEFQFYIEMVATGTTIPNVPLKGVRQYSFNLPPLEEQKTIAEVLSSLDDKIDLLHRQNKTLEELAQTLFRQWFIEEAKDEWEIGTLEDIIDFNPTHSLKKGEMYPFLEMGNVQTFKSSVAGWYDRAFTSGTKFKNGDTLLARITPSLENGKTAYIDFLEENQIGWGSTEFVVMRMKKTYHPFISYLIARNEDFRDFSIGNMTGSTGRQRAQAKDIKEYEIAIPSVEIIKKLNESIKDIPIKIKANSKQIKTLENMRDTLLPKLMSGEVRVKMNGDKYA